MEKVSSINGREIKDAAARESIVKTRSLVENRKFIFISDSYGNYTNENGKNWIDLLCQKCGISAENYHSIYAGSSGFTRTGSLKWQTMLQAAGINNKNEITDIIVGGGANDTLATYEENRTAINQFLLYVFANFPNAVVSLAHFGITFGKPEGTARAQTSLKAYREVPVMGGVRGKYIMNSEYILCNTTLLNSDRVHPNQAGVNSIAHHMISAITDGYCDVHYCVTSGVTYTENEKFSGFDSNITGGVKMYVNNNIAVMTGIGAGVILSTRSTTYTGKIGGETFYRDLIQLDKSVIPGGDGHTKVMAGTLKVTFRDSTYQVFPVMYFLEDYNGTHHNVAVHCPAVPNIEGVWEVSFTFGTVAIPTDL